MALPKWPRKILNEAGADDEQLEGIGWDGEYIKKGVKGKLMAILDLKNLYNVKKIVGLHRYGSQLMNWSLLQRIRGKNQHSSGLTKTLTLSMRQLKC